MTMPSHKNPCPGVMEFIILVGLFLVIIIIFTQFSDLFSRAEKKIFKVMHQFYTFYPKSIPPGVDGQEILNCVSFYPIKSI